MDDNHCQKGCPTSWRCHGQDGGKYCWIQCEWLDSWIFHFVVICCWFIADFLGYRFWQEWIMLLRILSRADFLLVSGLLISTFSGVTYCVSSCNPSLVVRRRCNEKSGANFTQISRRHLDRHALQPCRIWHHRLLPVGGYSDSKMPSSPNLSRMAPERCNTNSRILWLYRKLSASQMCRISL